MQTCLVDGLTRELLHCNMLSRKVGELLDSIAEALQEGHTMNNQVKMKPRRPKSKEFRRQAVLMELSDWYQLPTLEDNPEQLV